MADDDRGAEGNVLHVALVAAERTVWEGDAKMVVARTTEGDVGVLPGHQPMLGLLHGGIVEVRDTDDKIHVAAVPDGFISVSHNRVSLLAEHAAMSHEIDLEEAKRELADAREEQGGSMDVHDAVAARVRAAESLVRAAEEGDN